MNKIYCLVTDRRTGALVPVGEYVRACKKAAQGLGVVGLVSLFASSFSHAIDANTLPTGGHVSAGQASVSTVGTVMDVNQSGQRAAINWQSFNIGKDATVNFNQPNANAITLNRVVGNQSSVIDGALNANGNVWILNSNGVLFNRSARVDVGGIVASTLDIQDADFMAGRSTFESNGNKSRIINLGTINAADGGYVALLGNQVSNQGVISARLGAAALAAGDKISLNFNGNSLVNVTIDRGTLNALVENQQAILADGGLVVLTAKGLDTVMGAMVNNTGEIRAQSIAEKEGKIYLLGDMENGTVAVGGTLDASAPNAGDGGFIETSAAHVKTAANTHVTTESATGNSGQWLIDPNDYTIAASGGDIDGTTLANNLLTTNVTITSAMGANSGNGDIFVNDAINMQASSARHTLTLKAYRDIIFQDGSGIDATTNGNTNPLDIVLWANNGGAGGYVQLGHQSYVRSNGGNIWFGGGSGSATWHGLTVGNGYATGSGGSTRGIYIASGSYIDSGTGIVGMRANADVAGNNAIEQFWDGSYGNAHLTMLGGLEVYVQTGNVRFGDGEDVIGSVSNGVPTSTSIFDIGTTNNLQINYGGGGTAELNGNFQIVSANNVRLINNNWYSNPTLMNFTASTVSGILDVESSSSNGVITQTGALSVAGTSNFQGSTVTLTNTGNNFVGALSFYTENDAAFYNNRDLILDSVYVSAGNLNLSANGNISMLTPGSSYMEIDTGSVTLDVGTNHDISLDTGGYPVNGTYGDISIVAARNVSLTLANWNNPALTFGTSNISGNLSVQVNTYGTPADLNQDGVLHVAGTTTIQAIDLNWNPYTAVPDQTVPLSIVLNNTANVFGGAISVTGKNTTINASSDLIIGDMDVDNLLAVAGIGKNITQTGNIVTHAGNAVLVADSTNNGTYTNTGGTITTTGGQYYIYSHDPITTTVGALTPDFTHTGDTYTSYAPGSVTESGSGMIYLATTAPVISNPGGSSGGGSSGGSSNSGGGSSGGNSSGGSSGGGNTSDGNSSGGSSTSSNSNTGSVANSAQTADATNANVIVGSIANGAAVSIGATSTPSANATDVILPPTFVLAQAHNESVKRGTGAIVNVPSTLSLPGGGNTPLMVLSSPAAADTSTPVTLSQARAMMSSDGTTNDNHDVHVPLSRNSMADIVNGGVNLPGGVEQELFVVKQ